ncbi:cell division protein FtsQ/DivIB [Tenacibaculum amylolyticum]|uniref:cell division protein FtsQ/DivIB n=1 Tax=Tenacibaculum amylolyticum TaxID=104269 RepID=UPI0038931EFF
MNKKLGTYILFFSLLVLLLFLYGFTKKRNQERKIHAIEVLFEEGKNSFLTHEAVNKLLIQSQVTVKNQPKRIIDLHNLEGKVLSNPFVDEATVFITLGGLIKTQITQKEPVARIISDDGTYYVDKKGFKIPLSTNFSARVPLVNGVETAEEIKEITELVQIISEDDFLKKEITAIQKLKSNEYVFNVRSGDYRVFFGKYEDVGLKFKKLKAFYNKALKDKTINKYKTINVKYHNQVVCTKRNQDGKQQ